MPSSLDESWKNRCVLSKHGDAKKLDFSGSFKPSECCLLAFCKHQGVGKQAFHMHSNLVKCLKPLIRAIRQPKKKKGESIVPSNAKKTKTVYPEARTLLDKGFAVLKIESMPPTAVVPAIKDHHQQDHIEGESDSDENPMWKTFVQKRLVSKQSRESEEGELCEKHWLHIGFMNHSSSTFTVLPLSCDAEGHMVDTVFPENSTPYRSFEYFRDHIDTKKQWKCTLCQIICNTGVLTESEMMPGHPFEITKMSQAEPMIFWKGEAAEEARRASEAAVAEARLARKRKPRAYNRDLRPRRQLRLTDMFPEQPADAADDSAAIAAIEDIRNEHDKSSSASSEDKSSSESEEENEKEDFNSQLDNFHQGIDRHAAVANKPEDSENEGDVPDIDQSDIAAIQPASTVSSSSSSSSSAPVLPSPLPQPVPAVPAFEAPVASAPRARRHGRGSRDTSGAGVMKIDIPGHGELVYYLEMEAIQARCNVPGHGDCRKQRTTKQGNRPGQGRCIGLLTSWLMQGGQYPSQSEHNRSCHPSFEEREIARNLFETLEGSSEFLEVERPKRENEGDEPSSIA